MDIGEDDLEAIEQVLEIVGELDEMDSEAVDDYNLDLLRLQLEALYAALAQVVHQ